MNMQKLHFHGIVLYAFGIDEINDNIQEKITKRERKLSKSPGCRLRFTLITNSTKCWKN